MWLATARGGKDSTRRPDSMCQAGLAVLHNERRPPHRPSIAFIPLTPPVPDDGCKGRATDDDARWRQMAQAIIGHVHSQLTRDAHSQSVAITSSCQARPNARTVQPTMKLKKLGYIKLRVTPKHVKRLLSHLVWQR